MEALLARRLPLPLLLLLLGAFGAPNAGRASPDGPALVNEDVRRTVDLSSHLAKVTAEVVLAHPGGGEASARATSFLLALEPELEARLAHLGVQVSVCMRVHAYACVCMCVRASGARVRGPAALLGHVSISPPSSWLCNWGSPGLSLPRTPNLTDRGNTNPDPIQRGESLERQSPRPGFLWGAPVASSFAQFHHRICTRGPHESKKRNFVFH